MAPKENPDLKAGSPLHLVNVRTALAAARSVQDSHPHAGRVFAAVDAWLAAGNDRERWAAVPELCDAKAAAFGPCNQATILAAAACTDAGASRFYAFQAADLAGWYTGVVGERSELTLTVLHVEDVELPVEAAPGGVSWCRLYQMKDEAGRCLVWQCFGRTLFTGVGSTVRVRATVKAHEVDEAGRAVTYLQRVALVLPGTATAPRARAVAHG